MELETDSQKEPSGIACSRSVKAEKVSAAGWEMWTGAKTLS